MKGKGTTNFEFTSGIKPDYENLKVWNRLVCGVSINLVSKRENYLKEKEGSTGRHYIKTYNSFQLITESNRKDRNKKCTVIILRENSIDFLRKLVYIPILILYN